MARANYRFYAENDKTRSIVDVGPWDKHRTITNDAENVVKAEHEKGLGNRALFYYDSDWTLTELVHDGKGKFLDFRIL